jgi:GMP synthase (glutamine-hydrolysing)
MNQAIAIRHVSFEDAGILASLLGRHGVELATVDAWNIPAAAVEAPLVILLGGPVSVNDSADYPFLAEEIALARTRLAENRPTLGICLGAQILCRAVGGKVKPGTQKEIGWSPLALTDAGQRSVLAPLAGIPVLHWHGEICELPEGLPSLAATPACGAQAFAPTPSGLGLQFHAEAGCDGIESWLVGHSVEIGATPGVTVPRLRADTARHAAALCAAADTMFCNWLTAVGVLG